MQVLNSVQIACAFAEGDWTVGTGGPAVLSGLRSAALQATLGNSGGGRAGTYTCTDPIG